MIEIWPIPYWLKIIVGAFCLLHACIEFVMTLIYAGVVYYPNFGPSSFLAKSSLTSMLRSAAFATIFFLVAWPKLIAYLLAVLVVKAFLLLLLTIFANMFADYALQMDRASTALYIFLLLIYGGSLAAFLQLVAY